MEITRGIEGNDKFVNFFKVVKKLYIKSAKAKKISSDKLSPKFLLKLKKQINIKGILQPVTEKQQHGNVDIVRCQLLTSVVSVTLQRKEAKESV